MHVISHLLIIPFYSTFIVRYKHAGLNTATKSSAINQCHFHLEGICGPKASN